jgi:RNA polymerase sigma-70 factor (ECF subfamily)
MQRPGPNSVFLWLTFMPTERRIPAVTLTLVSSGDGGTRSTDGMPDWSRWMTRAQDGDGDAYRALLEDITPYLRSLAARCFKQHGDIEDAVQDVLLTLHAIRHTYDPARPFGPWLVAIANRRIIDRLRRDTRAKTREVALSAEHETFSDPATNLEGQDPLASGDLKVALKQLPADQQQAITLLKLNELSLKEAAAISGRSVASLKVATHRAIKKLRHLLRDKDSTP